MARTRKAAKPGGPEPKYVLINAISPKGQEVLNLMLALINENHEELVNANIIPAWMMGNKEDKDGHLILGKMKKASELEREAHGADGFLLLNHEAWEVFDINQRRALVDHELEHLALSFDAETAEPKRDGHDKLVYRLRKHDVEEFQCIIRRHGCWKDDLRKFAEDALKADKQKNLALTAG